MTEDPRVYDPAYMTEPATGAKGRAVVTATTLLVRAEPDGRQPVLGRLAQDVTVDVWAVAGDWAWVQAHGAGVTFATAADRPPHGALTGWCSRLWLRVMGRLAA
jgi:hypothetical protein